MLTCEDPFNAVIPILLKPWVSRPHFCLRPKIQKEKKYSAVIVMDWASVCCYNYKYLKCNELDCILTCWQQKHYTLMDVLLLYYKDTMGPVFAHWPSTLAAIAASDI